MRVHSFESLAAKDGEGLRYAVFLAGCPLRCVFCHNPDTWERAAGTEYSAEQLLAKIRRYKPYFLAGNGGVTFSGGEPLLQSEEIAELGRMLKNEGISFALDTSGCVSLTDSVKEAIALADHVILDLKFATEEAYKRHTGGSLASVLSFLEYLIAENKRIWIRTVIIPGINDTKEELTAYRDLLAPYRASIERHELLPFHTMGFFKYDKLGIQNPLASTPALSPERLESLKEFIE